MPEFPMKDLYNQLYSVNFDNGNENNLMITPILRNPARCMHY